MTVRQALDDQMSEADLERGVRDMAALFGWRCYHTWRSDHSPAGFPDLVLVRGPRLIFAELKSMKGRVTPEQRAWLDDLAKVPGIETHLWKPCDLDDIERVLGESASTRMTPTAEVAAPPPVRPAATSPRGATEPGRAGSSGLLPTDQEVRTAFGLGPTEQDLLVEQARERPPF